MSASDNFSTGFDFFSNISYPCGFQPMADPFIAQHFNTTSKPDFSYYERADLGPYHESTSASYIPSIPAYGL